MEVTKYNFDEVLPLFEESVNNCDFVAFDAEFSGKLPMPPWPVLTLSDWFRLCRDNMALRG